MSDEENPPEKSAVGDVSPPWPDAELVDRLRARDERATRELFGRFVPLLLDQARRGGVDGGERLEFVLDVLSQVVLDLCTRDVMPPRHLGRFLSTVTRRRLIDRRRRAAANRHVVPLDALRDAETPTAPGTPTDAEDASSGGGVPLVLVTLARHLDGFLDETDRSILLWLGERVPQRVIAEWLGIGHGAVRMRVSRLRDRLREVARTFVATFDADERVELARFFRRAGSTADTQSSHNPGRAPGGRRHGSST